LARPEPTAPTPPRRALVVANPISGRGRGARAGEELVRALEQRGVAAELLLTSARGDVGRLLGEAGAAQLVVAVGGDGTLSEVLAALPDPRPTVGLLPRGTANVLGRVLRLPERIDEAAEAFARGRTRALDVARVGRRRSHLVVGVGLDARAVHEVEARRRGPITKASYFGATLRALRRHRPVPLVVTVDGERLPGTFGQVWVSNTPRYADLLRLAPDARIDDGLLEVYLFPTGRLPELLLAGLRGLVGHLPGGAVRMRRGRAFRIEAPEPVPCQVDGDLEGTTPVSVELLPESFRLAVP
jgi:diacylglycerol kinase (ATP)